MMNLKGVLHAMQGWWRFFFLGEHVIDDDEYEDVLYKLNQSFKCSPNEMY